VFVVEKFKAGGEELAIDLGLRKRSVRSLPEQRLARLALFSGVKENVDKNEGSRSFCVFVYDDE
jgi:hypothetical protein